MVIKANAWPWSIEIAAYMDAEVDMFGVASIDEARARSGITAPILLMEGCFDGSEWPMASKQFRCCCSFDEQWQELSVQEPLFLSG